MIDYVHYLVLKDRLLTVLDLFKATGISIGSLPANRSEVIGCDVATFVCSDSIRKSISSDLSPGGGIFENTWTQETSAAVPYR